jgi:ligand-binding SRPBCC domain-containing protein
MPQIRLETIIRASPGACFELSLSVDAHSESMRQSGEKVVAGVTSGLMRLGDTVTWRARHFGIFFRMTSRISLYEAPHRFVDEQVSGPFASWRHEHRFEVIGAGTRMVDLVDFASPVGPVGRLVDRLVLAGYLTRLLQQRNRWLADELSRRDAGSPEDRGV